MGESGQVIQNKILLKFGALKTLRLWRANSGVAVGYSLHKKTVSMAAKTGLITHAQPTRYGTVGQTDIQGITHEGRGIFIEVKGKGDYLKKEQKNYRDMILKYNGIWILAKSVEDVEKEFKCLKLI